MCHAAQEAIAQHRKYINRKTKSIVFAPMLALRSLTQIQPNLLLRCPQIYLPNLKQIIPADPEIAIREQNFEIISSCFFFFILHTSIFAHKMQMHTLIELKLDTHRGLIKAHLRTNFGWNPIKTYGVMIDFSRKRRSKICHAYRVNRWKNLAFRWSNHHRSAFLWFERKDHGDMTQNPTGVRAVRSNL